MGIDFTASVLMSGWKRSDKILPLVWNNLQWGGCYCYVPNELTGKKKKVPVTVRHQDVCCQHLKLSSEMAWKIQKNQKTMTHAGTEADLLSTSRFLRRWGRRGRSAHSQVGSGRSRWCPTQTPSPPAERWLQEGAGDTSPLWGKVKKLVSAERMQCFMTFCHTVVSHFRIMAGWQLCNNILAE